MTQLEKIIASMNMMLKNTEVVGLIPTNKKMGSMTFGYNTNDYTLYFSNADIYVSTNFGFFVADKINL
jgi:hypothetical protein